MAIVISQKILAKLADALRPITANEIEECFLNHSGGLLQDDREDHKTESPTQWFIASTNRNRKLKVVFVQRGSEIFVKTAYDPSVDERFIYEKFGA